MLSMLLYIPHKWVMISSGVIVVCLFHLCFKYKIYSSHTALMMIFVRHVCAIFMHMYPPLASLNTLLVLVVWNVHVAAEMMVSPVAPDLVLILRDSVGTRSGIGGGIYSSICHFGSSFFHYEVTHDNISVF